MIVFRPVGLNAPPQVWPATRPHRARVDSCRKTTKMEITVSCILDASSSALSWVGSGFAFLLSGVLCPWFLRFFYWQWFVFRRNASRYCVGLVRHYVFTLRIKQKSSASQDQVDQILITAVGRFLTGLWSKSGLHLNWLRNKRQDEELNSEKKEASIVACARSTSAAHRKLLTLGILIESCSFLVQY